MKTILSIIAAFALLVAFSMPAMADPWGGGSDTNKAKNNDGSAVAQDHSSAYDVNVNHPVTVTKNINKYDNDVNAIAVGMLKQVNVAIGKHVNIDSKKDDSCCGDIKLIGSADEFAGILNLGINTGDMSNQAAQNVIAVSVRNGGITF